MLKLLFWLLLIGNAVLFGMQRGYLGATPSERHEPKRLTQQLHPETLTILPANSEKLVSSAKADAPAGTVAAVATADAAKDAKPSKPDATPPEAKAPAAEAAPAPPAAPVVACTEFGNFNAVEVRKFDAQLSSLNLAVKPTTRSVQEAASHMVYIPTQDGKDGADRKAAELRRLGIQDFYVMPESQANPALRWAISLGVFKTEEAAKAYIGRLIPQGVRSARIMARNVTSNKQAYQWRNVDAATKTALDGLKAKFPNQEMRSCAS